MKHESAKIDSISILIDNPSTLKALLLTYAFIHQLTGKNRSSNKKLLVQHKIAAKLAKLNRVIVFEFQCLFNFTQSRFTLEKGKSA